jgi:hypothetical protein
VRLVLGDLVVFRRHGRRDDRVHRGSRVVEPEVHETVGVVVHFDELDGERDALDVADVEPGHVESRRVVRLGDEDLVPGGVEEGVETAVLAAVVRDGDRR